MTIFKDGFGIAKTVLNAQPMAVHNKNPAR